MPCKHPAILIDENEGKTDDSRLYVVKSALGKIVKPSQATDCY